jgi:zinc protease
VTGYLPQPEVGRPAAWRFPRPERSQLSNGIDLVVFRLPGQYVIAGHLILDLPLNVEDRALEGIATITARTLDEGSLTHPGEEFAELLETEGAGFGIDVALSGTQAVLDVPASRLDRALPLFAEALVEPALGDEDIQRHVQLRLAEIEQAQANSAQLASMMFRRAVFDSACRASRMSGGEPTSVAAVEPEPVRAFHRDHFGPRGATLILAGDFVGDPLALAEQAFGGWAVPSQVGVEQQAPTPAPRKMIIVDRPGSVQADVRLGGFGIDRHHPAWADITVASYAMGGAFLSRLNAVLREDKGYTYGVRLGFAPLRTAGSYALQGSFRTDVVPDAITTALDLLDTSSRPFTATEVADAIAFFVGVSPLRYATADGVADQAANNALAGLDDDYVDDNLAALASVTPESATAAYESLVHRDELTLVVVGDADRLADPLRALGMVDLEVVQA